MTDRRPGRRWWRALSGVLASLLLVLIPASRSDVASAVTSQLVANGGFEDGTSGWATSSVQGRALVSQTAARSGSSSADLCGGDSCNDELEQTFRVPARVVSATLSYSVRFDSSEPQTASCFDATGVGIFDPGQTQLYKSSTCNAQADRAFHEERRDVTAVLAGREGQVLTLALGADTDGSFPSRAFWDNVRLDVDGAAVQAPPTDVQAYASGPGSAVISWGASAGAGPRPTSYEVQASTGARAVVPGSGRRAELSGLPADKAVSFTVTASSASGTGPPVASNPVRPSEAAPISTAWSDQQYQLTDSDGVSWKPVDPANLSLAVKPASSGQLWLTANADLWTAAAGVNQDLGIRVNGRVVAWKESGGFAGAFSPNAAAVTALVPITSGTPVLVELVWKTNIPAPRRSVFAGAGPIAGNFSPTRLSAEVIPAGGTRSASTAVSGAQASLQDSDGATWKDMGVGLSVPGSGDGVTTLFAGADLWTKTAGINQDLGVMVSTSDGKIVNQLVGWKESGGYAGTYSPNAALVVGVFPSTVGVTAAYRLVWKANRPAVGATIVTGAGSAPNVSPTSLTALTVPAGSIKTAASTQQYQLRDGDGETWEPLGGDELAVTVTPAVDSLATISASADLWTQEAGYNQDLSVRVSPADGGPGSMAWKESGGSAGTFSPNAAAVLATSPMIAGRSYRVTLAWKANRLSPQVTIRAGAGSGPGFSPTRLLVALTPVPS